MPCLRMTESARLMPPLGMIETAGLVPCLGMTETARLVPCLGMTETARQYDRKRWDIVTGTAVRIKTLVLFVIQRERSDRRNLIERKQKNAPNILFGARVSLSDYHSASGSSASCSARRCLLSSTLCAMVTPSESTANTSATMGCA